MKTFSVHVVGDVLVPDYRAQEQNQNRFVGREFLPPFKAKPGPHELLIDSSVREKEYVAELRAGSLLPADEATAKAAGMKWPLPAAEPAPASANTESPSPAPEPTRKTKTPNSEGK